MLFMFSNKKMSSLKSSDNIYEIKKGHSAVSAITASSVTLYGLAKRARESRRFVLPTFEKVN